MQTNNICTHCNTKNLIFHADRTEHTCFFCSKVFSTNLVDEPTVEEGLIEKNTVLTNQTPQVSLVPDSVETPTQSLAISNVEIPRLLSPFPVFIQPNTHDGEFQSNLFEEFYDEFDFYERIEDPEYKEFWGDSTLEMDEDDAEYIQNNLGGAKNWQTFIDSLPPVRQVFHRSTLYTQAGVSYLTHFKNNDYPIPLWLFKFNRMNFTCVEKEHTEPISLDSFVLGDSHVYGPFSLQLRHKLEGTISQTVPSELSGNTIQTEPVTLLVFQSVYAVVIYLKVGAQSVPRVFVGKSYDELNLNYEEFCYPLNFKLQEHFIRFQCQLCSNIFVQPKLFKRNNKTQTFQLCCFACGNANSNSITIQDLGHNESFSRFGVPKYGNAQGHGEIADFCLGSLNLRVKAQNSIQANLAQSDYINLDNISFVYYANPYLNFYTEILFGDRHLRIYEEEVCVSENEKGVWFGKTLFAKVKEYQCVVETVEGCSLAPFRVDDVIIVTFYKMQIFELISIKTNYSTSYFQAYPRKTEQFIEKVGMEKILMVREVDMSTALSYAYSSGWVVSGEEDFLVDVVAKDPIPGFEFQFNNAYFHNAIDYYNNPAPMFTVPLDPREEEITLRKFTFIIFILIVLFFIVMNMSGN